jgi:hypothetical protein
MWFVIVGVISLGLGVLAVVGLLAVARELIVERPFETDSGTMEPPKVNLRAAEYPGFDAR